MRFSTLRGPKVLDHRFIKDGRRVCTRRPGAGRDAQTPSSVGNAVAVAIGYARLDSVEPALGEAECSKKGPRLNAWRRNVRTFTGRLHSACLTAMGRLGLFPKRSTRQ